jgi:sugar (pentulose or hexulose) kinase
MKLVIGIDSSTTACKAIAWDRQGRPVGEARKTYPTAEPRPGWHDQDAELWWSSLCRALQELLGRVEARSLEALCITDQRETIVALDRQGRPLRPAMLWLDERSRAQLDELEGSFGARRFHEITGKPLSTVPSVMKMLWLARQEPQVFARTARFAEPHAFLVERLTGRWCTSLACADPMGLVDMRRRSWSEALLSALGFREEQLPRLVEPAAVAGTVGKAAAGATGLPEGLPVVAGAGDGQCAGLGAGIVEPGRAYLILGTAVVSGLVSREYRVDQAFRTLFAPFADAYYLETVIKAGAFTTAWFAERFAGQLKVPSEGSSVEELLEQAAARVSPGALGLVLVPYWHGVTNPYWDADASGITVGWRGCHGPEHLYRAILEGIAFEQRLAGEAAAAAAGQKVGEYLAVGGGSRSLLWCQILADVTNLPVRRTVSPEATALGAGMLAAVGAGWYGGAEAAARAMARSEEPILPDAQRAALYDRIFREVYVALFPALREILGRLSRVTEA